MSKTQPTSFRFTLIDKEQYEVDLEYNEEFFILHLPRVDKLTKGVYEELKKTSDEILKFAYVAGYDAIYLGIPEEKTSTKKLAERLGFSRMGSAQGMDVYIRRA